LTWINIVAVKPIYALQMTVREPTLLGVRLAASFLCAAPILLHVSPAKTVPPLVEPAITSNTALSLLLGGGDGDAQWPRYDLT
jgi:hypothetical protein